MTTRSAIARTFRAYLEREPVGTLISAGIVVVGLVAVTLDLVAGLYAVWGRDLLDLILVVQSCAFVGLALVILHRVRSRLDHPRIRYVRVPPHENGDA